MRLWRGVGSISNVAMEVDGRFAKGLADKRLSMAHDLPSRGVCSESDLHGSIAKLYGFVSKLRLWMGTHDRFLSSLFHRVAGR